LKTRVERSQLDTFVNQPDKHPSRWGDALTADKMKKCVWLRPDFPRLLVLPESDKCVPETIS
jgi:hypothetical protein